MSRFERVDDEIRCTWHRAEYDLVMALYEQLSGVIAQQNPDDQRFRRLFPPAVLGTQMAEPDPQQIHWRQNLLTSHGQWLASATLHRGIYKLRFPVEDVDAILQFINDLRLMIGASIDIDVFDRETLPADDDRQTQLAIIDHLAWWQEEILSLISDDV